MQYIFALQESHSFNCLDELIKKLTWEINDRENFLRHLYSIVSGMNLEVNQIEGALKVNPEYYLRSNKNVYIPKHHWNKMQSHLDRKNFIHKLEELENHMKVELPEKFFQGKFNPSSWLRAKESNDIQQIAMKYALMRNWKEIKKYESPLRDFFIESFSQSYLYQHVSMTEDELIKAFNDVWKHIDDEHWNFLVMLSQEKEIIGFAVWQYLPKCAYIAQFAIKSSHWRQGLGNFMMVEIAKEIEKKGIQIIYGVVREQNQFAVNFYKFLGAKENGFQQEGYDPKVYKTFVYNIAENRFQS